MCSTSAVVLERSYVWWRTDNEWGRKVTNLGNSEEERRVNSGVKECTVSGRSGTTKDGRVVMYGTRRGRGEGGGSIWIV